MNESTKESPKKIGAIVLAAGTSHRMGTNKALLPIDGKPMLLGIVETIASNVPPIQPILVITGHKPDAILSLLLPLQHRVEFVQNENYQVGMLSSVKAGLTALRSRCDACLLVLGDQPLVKRATIKLLIEHWLKSSAEVVRPTFGGKRGHPIVLAESCIAPILALNDDATLNHFVSTAHVLDVVVDDESTTLDLDTPADYTAFLVRRKK